MSRSVIMPTRRSFSPTGMEPALISSIIFATSRIDCPGVATRTSRVIASLTRMTSPSLGLLPPCPKQDVDRDGYYRDGDRYACADREGGRRNDEDACLRRRRFGRGDGEEGRRRDQHPAADVGDEDPAHGAVVRARDAARCLGTARRV